MYGLVLRCMGVYDDVCACITMYCRDGQWCQLLTVSDILFSLLFAAPDVAVVGLVLATLPVTALAKPQQ